MLGIQKGQAEAAKNILKFGISKEDIKWICYNDSSVSMISDTDAAAIAKKVYVFFYKPNQYRIYFI